MNLLAQTDLQWPSLWPAREYTCSWLQRCGYDHGSEQHESRESKSSISSFHQSYELIFVLDWILTLAFSLRGSKSTCSFCSLKSPHSWWAWVFCLERRRWWMWRCLLQPKVPWIFIFLWTSPIPCQMIWTTWREWAKNWVRNSKEKMLCKGTFVFILALMDNVVSCSFISEATVRWLHHWLWKVCWQSCWTSDRHETCKVRQNGTPLHWMILCFCASDLLLFLQFSQAC